MGAICSSSSSANVEPIRTTNPAVNAVPSARQEPAKPPEQQHKPAEDLHKCLGAFNPLVSEVTAQGKRYLVTCTVASETNGLAFCTRAPDDHLHSAELPPAQLLADAALQRVPWPAFFAALRRHFQERTLQYVISGATHTLTIRLDGLNPPPPVVFPILLGPAQRDVIQRLLVTPLLDYYFARKAHWAQDEPFRQQEVTCAGLAWNCTLAHRALDEAQKEVETARQESAAAMAQCKLMKERCEQVRTQIRRLRSPDDAADYLYGAPWQRYPLHTPYCQGWSPTATPHNEAAAELVRTVHAGHRYSSSRPPAKASKLPHSPSDPNLRLVLEAGGASGAAHEDILRTLEKIDDWDFDVFQLQQQCKGGSLFMVAYCLLHKYGFVQHFGIDPDVVVNWCTAMEAGYHPNPYHNSTHAADVTQVLHYILFPGGMFKAIPISVEDAFAAIISGTIHDFDHPGFNNNFHVRTNAYLALLYNDRSVLENHHCAAVFDLMKDPKYNLLHSLNAEQRKDVRDTILEMVLSTDMGNHAKIFQTFRKRLQDEGEWRHKDDIRLALSIAIKMADISNCGRPQNLYLQWANKIAEEFYKQGDVERQLHFQVSPFMDRLNHKTDFAKGQMSFMNYIVIPLFEAGAEFVQPLEWTVQRIQENKEYWQRMEEEDAEGAP
eukprot:EG_transcript_4490